MRKNNTFKNIFKFCKEYTSVSWIKITLFYTLSILNVIIGIFAPININFIVEQINKGGDKLDMNIIALFSGIMILCYLICFIIGIIVKKIELSININVCVKLRGRLIAATNHAEYENIKNENMGVIMDILDGTTWGVSNSIFSSVCKFIICVVQIVLILIIILIFNWMIGLVVTAFSILSILISCIIFHFSKKLNYKNFRASSHLSGKINEMVNSLPIINSFNAQDKISSKLIQNNRIILGSQFKTDFFYGFNAPVIELINKICFFSVIIVACILINFNDNKLGFTQLPFFIALTFLIQGPISETCGIINSFSWIAVCCDRISSFLKRNEIKKDEKDLKNSVMISEINSIVFKNVDFYYGKTQIIHDFNLTINKGEKIAFVGKTGAGKTTLINILLGLYDIKNGEILINDIPFQLINKKSYREKISFIDQETWIFEDTIYNNLTLGAKDAKMENVIDICEKIGIINFIDSCTDKFQTILSNNLNISAGEKQLLTFARALIQNHSFLLFDEATSNIDTKIEKQIQESQKILLKDKTSVLIAHRLSTILDADKIVVLKEGRILQVGRHEELLAIDGEYADLYKSQFSDVE